MHKPKIYYLKKLNMEVTIGGEIKINKIFYINEGIFIYSFIFLLLEVILANGGLPITKSYLFSNLCNKKSSVI